MRTDIYHHRARYEEKIAQHKTKQETRNEAVGIAVRKREEQGCDKYCRMGIAKPALKSLLNRPPEKEFLAQGRYQSHNKQLQQQVARSGERQQFLDRACSSVGVTAK
jgi:hypothetical protein